MKILKKFFEKREKTQEKTTKKEAEPRDRQCIPDKTNFLRDFTENLRKDNEFSSSFGSLFKEEANSSSLPLSSEIEKETQGYEYSDSSKPIEITPESRELLKRSIVISLDFPVNRPDLSFVANSKLDGRPIYRYVGPMPFRLDIPFEELVSLENSSEIKNESIVSDYVDYLSDQLDRSIQYSEYVAEQVNRNLRIYHQDDLRKRKSEMRKTWMQRYGNSHSQTFLNE